VRALWIALLIEGFETEGRLKARDYLTGVNADINSCFSSHWHHTIIIFEIGAFVFHFGMDDGLDQWRITMLGDGGVGKTALAVQVSCTLT